MRQNDGYLPSYVPGVERLRRQLVNHWAIVWLYPQRKDPIDLIAFDKGALLALAAGPFAGLIYPFVLYEEFPSFVNLLLLVSSFLFLGPLLLLLLELLYLVVALH